MISTTSFKGRPIIPGRGCGEVVVVESISFYGDVDPKQGVLVKQNVGISRKILIVRRSRGSTVGSYILYALKYYGKEPLGIVIKKAEPIIVTGCVMANIPLIEGVDDEFFDRIENGRSVCFYEDGTVEVTDG